MCTTTHLRDTNEKQIDQLEDRDRRVDVLVSFPVLRRSDLFGQSLSQQIQVQVIVDDRASTALHSNLERTFDETIVTKTSGNQKRCQFIFDR